MKTIITILLILWMHFGYTQVGIATTSPQAILDVSASNKVTPSSTDGILIPRVDTFSAINPTLAQDAMLVYLTTTAGTDAPGFYYWNNATTTWLPFGGATVGWDILGNTGTTSGTNFLGTTDNQALDIRTNNIIHHRFKTDGKIDVLNTGNSVYIGENAGNADPTTTDKENVIIGNFAGENVTTGAAAVYEGKYVTAVGFKALNSLTTANRNTAIGHQAAMNVTTGDYNTALGMQALAYTTDKKYNTAIGMEAVFNMNGHGNTGIGYRALSGNAPTVAAGSGQYNTAVGYSAGLRALNGSDNVFLGKFADLRNGTGNQNVVVGSGAGTSAFITSDLNLTGRVLLGYQAGKDIATNNVLYIENSASVTPLVYGEFDNDIVRIGGQLQIGSNDDTTAGAIYSFPVIDGTVGQVLTTDGAGVVSWGAGGGVASDHDWYEQGTTTAPNAITDNIFTNGNVGIGDITPDANLDISSTGDTLLIVEGDSDNSGEGDSPEIRLVQDGGDRSSVQLEGIAGTLATGTIANAMILHTRSGESGAPIQMVSNSLLNTTFKPNGGVQLNQYTTATSFTGTATSLLAIDASGNIIQAPISAGGTDWSLLGNAGTTAGTNFLGTTDNQALDIRTNNVIHHRFTTNGKLEILNTGNSVYIGENAGNADPTTTDKENVIIGAFAGENVTTGASQVYHGKYTTGVGYSALNSLTRGNRNTAIGHSAASNITTGNFNTVVGVAALGNATTIRYNTAVGMQAIYNMNGNGNTAMGYRALSGRAPNSASGSGRYNTAMGYNTAQRALSGNDNVFLGKQVDYRNGTGDNNVVIGSGAGVSTVATTDINLTGRVLIGFEAGKDIVTNNVLYIENSASATPLIGGDFATDRVGVNTDVSTLTHTFTVTGTAKITQLLNLTPATVPISPTEGDIYYDSATKKLKLYTGAAWENLN